jgi:hypothetical protein
MIKRFIPTEDEQLLALNHMLFKRDKMSVLGIEETRKFLEFYKRVLETVERYVPEDGPDREVVVNIGTFFDTGGHQIIFEGAVSNLKKPSTNSYNWHLQNTSQWLFGFGCVFDVERRDFSLHT